LELSEKAKVSLRTVQDVEWGRRQNFSESTLICLCRALDLDYRELMKKNGLKKGKIYSPGFLIVSLFALIILLIIILSFTFAKRQVIIKQEELKRVDWVKLLNSEEIRIEAITPPWKTPNGLVINLINLKQLTKVNEVLKGEIKWSYHYQEGEYSRNLPIRFYRMGSRY
jgi:hypothetical protein